MVAQLLTHWCLRCHVKAPYVITSLLTSIFNAVITGSKKWILYPPGGAAE